MQRALKTAGARKPTRVAHTAKIVAERFAWEKISMAPANVMAVAHKVSRALDDDRVTHVLAGGLAVGHYGFNRATQDVDFLISKSDMPKVEALFGPSKPLTGHLSGRTVVVDEVDVDFLFVAKTVKRGDLTTTEQYAGLPIVGLDPLIAMKMGAGRSKDTLDVVELLKSGKVSIENVTIRLKKFVDALEDFQSLIHVANAEKANAGSRTASRLLIKMLARRVERAELRVSPRRATRKAE